MIVSAASAPGRHHAAVADVEVRHPPDSVVRVDDAPLGFEAHPAAADEVCITVDSEHVLILLRSIYSDEYRGPSPLPKPTRESIPRPHPLARIRDSHAVPGARGLEPATSDSNQSNRISLKRYGVADVCPYPAPAIRRAPETGLFCSRAEVAWLKILRNCCPDAQATDRACATFERTLGLVGLVKR